MTRKYHHPLICVLHWLAAVLIIAALVMSALVMPGIPDDSPEKIDALRRHMSAGVLIFVLTALRFVVRRKVRRPNLPSSGMRWADGLARVVHRVFDVLILTMVSSGAGMALLGGLLAVVFGGDHLPVSLDGLTLHSVHRYTAMALFAILTTHVGGALYHQIVLRDELLSRMAFSFARIRAVSYTHLRRRRWFNAFW